MPYLTFAVIGFIGGYLFAHFMIGIRSKIAVDPLEELPHDAVPYKMEARPAHECDCCKDDGK